VVVVLGEGGEAGDVLHVDRALRQVLLHAALVVAVLLLLLQLEHAHRQSVQHRLPQHLLDQTVGLRQEVLSVVRIADPPLV
jgi:hypothetical protein